MSSSDNARDFAPGDDLPPACLSARRDVRRVQEVLGAAMAIGGFLVALFLINASTGFFQDDDVCHYNIAREGWHDAGKAWHNWGRPGYTLPTMVAAHFFGMYGCRVFSALQMMFVAYLAFRIARHLAPPVVGRAGPTNLLAALAPAFAPVMVWAQPLTMQLSLTTVLEVPSALYLTLAVWLYIRGNRAWSGVALSPLFITRYETLALVPIFALVAIADAINDWEQKRLATSDKPPGNSKEEKPKGNGKDNSNPGRGRSRVASGLWLVAMPLGMLWAPLMYIAAAWIIGLPKEMTPWGMFGRHYTAFYGSGGWTWFLERILLEMAGGGILAFAAAGAIGLDRRARLVWLLAGGLIVLHTYIYMRGMLESGGYARFLVPEAGLLGALAAGGLAVLLKWRNRVAVVAALAVLMFHAYWAERWSWFSLLNWFQMWHDLLDPILPMGWYSHTVVTSGDAKMDWLLVGLLVMAILAAGVRWKWLRVSIAWAVVFVCVSAGVRQARVQIEPLSLERDPYHVLAAAATTDLRDQYAGRPAMACHVLVPYFRPGTSLTDGCKDAMERWIQCKPGTLYFWDAKYGRECYDTLGPFHEELTRRGHLIWSESHDYGRMDVFERLDDSATQPTDP